MAHMNSQQMETAMIEATFDLTRLAERLAGLESEMNRKPALRTFLDADLGHNLCALRLMTCRGFPQTRS
jgi:hypothetical protein